MDGEDDVGGFSMPYNPKVSIEFQTRRQNEEIQYETRRASSSEQSEREIIPTTSPDTAITVPDTEKSPDFHEVDLSVLEQRFQSDVKKGLSKDEARERRSRNGPNIIAPPRTPVILVILGYLFSGFNGMLWVSSLAGWIAWRPLGDPNPDPVNLGLAIILIVVALISAFFSWWQEYQSGSVMKTIQGLLPNETLVMRGGELTQTATADLVVGDIVVINNGDRIPADLRIVTTKGLKIDQAALTGESEPITMSTKCTNKLFLQTKNIAFMGTSVVEGSGTGIVITTGNNTVMGSITFSAAGAADAPTYLQLEIRRIIIIILVIAIITAAAILFTWGFYLRPTYPNFLSPSAVTVSIIGMMVGYLPVGLPVCLTLALTVVGKEMYSKNVLVKKLQVIESLGSIDILASDKTGTLTQNKMSVFQFWLDGKLTDVTPEIFRAQPSESFSHFIRCLSLCNGAKFVNSGDERKIDGNASDVAIVNFAEKLLSVEAEQKKNPKVYEVPFNSKNKYMITLHRNSKKKDVLLIIKGAAEMLLRSSTQIKTSSGVQDLSREVRDKINDTIQTLGSQGQRVLAVCMRELKATKEFPVFSPKFNSDDYDIPTNQLTFIGLLGIIDPPRDEVPSVISQCLQAGVRVMMVTGDHPNTAAAIARKVGIIVGDKVEEVTNAKIPELILSEQTNSDQGIPLPAIVINGSEIMGFTPIIWEWILTHKEIVFARTSPEHKLLIVKACQQRGHVVGVTGDGVNDAPALKQAECGVAMGAGSDVAREAADLVLVDNNFSSVLTGIKYGRLVFANLVKVVLYLFPAGSFSEILPLLTSVFLGLPLPLSAFLMIYICCITDVLPSLSLVKEQPESDLMKKKPHNRNKHIFSFQTILQAYGFLGVVESLCAFVMYFWFFQSICDISPSQLFLAFDEYSAFKDRFGNATQTELDNCRNGSQSAFFVALVIMQFFNVLSSRTQTLSFFKHNPFYGPGQNLRIFIAMAISLVCALFVVYAPFMNNVFGTFPVPVQFWFVPVAFGVGLFCLEEIRKLIIRAYKRHKQQKKLGVNNANNNTDNNNADNEKDSEVDEDSSEESFDSSEFQVVGAKSKDLDSESSIIV